MTYAKLTFIKQSLLLASVSCVALFGWVGVSCAQEAGVVSALGDDPATQRGSASAAESDPAADVIIDPSQPIVPPTPAPQPPVAASGIVPPAPSSSAVVSAPSDSALSAPSQAPTSSGATQPSVQTSAHSGTFYDSYAIVPDRDLADSGMAGPRKVDPAVEPGQVFVTVEKGASASSYEGQFVAATRALKLGRYAAAVEMFEALYKKNHKDPRILMGLAVAQQGAGFVESAARTYEDVLKIDPDNVDAVVNLMGIFKAQYPSAALQKLTALRSKYPGNSGILAQIALVNADMKNYDEAIRNLQIAASFEPDNASYIYNMAILLDRQGKKKEAAQRYEDALRLDAAYGDTANTLPRDKILDRLSVLRRTIVK